MPSSKPRFPHDCDDCVYLGQFREYDLYFCPNEPTIICRFGKDGDYGSGVTFAFSSSPKICYAECLYRAIQNPEFLVIIRKDGHLQTRDVEALDELVLIAECDTNNYPALLADIKHMKSFLEHRIQEDV